MEKERKGRRNVTIFSNISKNANQPTHLMGLSCCTPSLHFFLPHRDVVWGRHIYKHLHILKYIFLFLMNYNEWLEQLGSINIRSIPKFITDSFHREMWHSLQGKLSNTLRRYPCKMFCSRHENLAATIEQLGEGGRHCLNVPISSHRPSWPSLIVPYWDYW